MNTLLSRCFVVGLPAEVQWEETLVLGPILLEELTEVTAFSPEQLSLLRMQEEETGLSR